VPEALHERLEDRVDALLEFLVEDELAAAKARHHLDGHVVRGRAEATARQDQVDALIGHEAQLRLDVLRAIAADRDVGELDAQLEQAIREPGAVAVLHAAAEHLGAGHDDAGASAHAQGRSPSGSGRRPRTVNSKPTGSGPVVMGTGLPFLRI
jgi:hypothetical protein